MAMAGVFTPWKLASATEVAFVAVLPPLSHMTSVTSVHIQERYIHIYVCVYIFFSYWMVELFSVDF
jgi:hypothetical protein